MRLFRSTFSGISLVAVLVLILALPLSARHGEGGWGGPPGPPMFFDDLEFMKDTLNLSDAQIEAVGKINRTHHTKMLEFKKQLRPRAKELRRLLRTDPVNMAAVKNILREISLIEADIRFERISHHMDIEKILTPEQREKLRSERRHMPPPPPLPPPGDPEGEWPDD